MIIERQILEDVLLLKPKIHDDGRGYFFESFKENFFDELGLSLKFVQDNQVYSNNAGVIRGLHYQLQKPQGKLVHVVSGAIMDVAVDILSHIYKSIAHFEAPYGFAGNIVLFSLIFLSSIPSFP